MVKDVVGIIKTDLKRKLDHQQLYEISAWIYLIGTKHFDPKNKKLVVGKAEPILRELVWHFIRNLFEEKE